MSDIPFLLRNKQVAFDEHQYISPIFTVPKKDKNEYRMILNLKELNEYIEPHHFKMETFESALKLINWFHKFSKYSWCTCNTIRQTGILIIFSPPLES
jgi:hypothetical protein